jgi:hypothetical protein
MKLNKTRLTVAAMGTAAMVGMFTFGLSSVASAKGAHFSNPGVTDTGTLKSGTNLVFSGGTIDGVGVVVTCTNFSAGGVVPSKGLTIKLSGPPTISGCTDNVAGTDSINTKGKWSLVANSSGTQVTLKMPKKGATFSSSTLSGCTVTAGPANITGAYNSSVSPNTDTVSNGGPIKLKGKGCTTGGTTVANSTIVFSQQESVVG